MPIKSLIGFLNFRETGVELGIHNRRGTANAEIGSSLWSSCRWVSVGETPPTKGESHRGRALPDCATQSTAVLVVVVVTAPSSGNFPYATTCSKALVGSRRKRKTRDRRTERHKILWKCVVVSKNNIPVDDAKYGIVSNLSLLQLFDSR